MSTFSDSVLSRNSTIQSTSTISFQETVDSSSYSPSSISESHKASSLTQEIQSKRHLLAELDEEHKHYVYQNHQLSEQLSRIQEKSEKKWQQLEIQRTNYNRHLASLRCTMDDPTSISVRLKDLQQNIKNASNELLPHISNTEVAAKFKSLWLNLANPIDQLDMTNEESIRMLTEKFMMDVLIQNLNINYFPGLSCNAESVLILQDWLEVKTESSFYSTRLRQEIASIIKEQEQELLEEPITKSWQYLYRGLQRVYPGLKDKQERIKLHALVTEAVSLGLAIKGQENLITAVDVREGSQPLDPILMKEVQGKSSGIVTFCISPPFVIKMKDNRYHTLMKGLVFCQD
ncbi:hypothetical protein K501DRAFT_320660 [Backusella circina FSU 941]|nr:hypothetical protein K501DRAFT_320660 [Backusella circina FSU 941]